MNPTQHPSNNRVIGAPRGWDQRELPCGALAVTDTVQGEYPAMASFWRPEPEELAALNAGGLVMLQVIGAAAHPVVSIGVALP